MIDRQVRDFGLALVWASLFGTSSGCGHTRAGADIPVGPLLEFRMELAQGTETALADGLLALGEIEQGGRTSRTLFVRNVSRSAISIKDVSYSCECVTLTSLPAEIVPGGAEQVQLNINLEDEPSFVGEMQVEVSLFLRDTSDADLESIPLRIRFRVVPRHPADTTE